MIWVILGFVILEFVFFVWLFKKFHERLEDLETSKRYHRYSSDDEHSQKLYTIPISINMKMEKLEERIKNLEDRVTQLNNIPKPANYSNHPVKIHPEVLEEPVKDDKIWVWRTEEGLKKLEPVSNPHSIYLLKDGENYLLYLENLNIENINDIIRLYSDIIDFPANIQLSDQIIMKKNPQYKKQGNYYIFHSKGEVSIK